MDQRVLVGDGGRALGRPQELQEYGEEFGVSVDKKAAVLIGTMLERAIKHDLKIFTQR